MDLRTWDQDAGPTRREDVVGKDHHSAVACGDTDRDCRLPRHRYLRCDADRGTPAIVESIRAGLVFALKDAVGTDRIQANEERLWQHALRCWSGNPNIEILGNHDARRLSIVSFRIRIGDKYLHHNYVVALLNDLFGIQARGGCSCAGPYGHRLLAIDATHSDAFRHEIEVGRDGIKPGWARLNFNYFISDTVRDYLIDAVDLVARQGHRLLEDYRFQPHTGLWRHHAGPSTPLLRLTDVHWDADPPFDISPRTMLGEDVLAAHLTDAAAIFAQHSDRIAAGTTGLNQDFEALRWFHLPPACLESPE